MTSVANLMIGLVLLTCRLGKMACATDMVTFLKDFQEQSTLAFASALAYKLVVERIGQK